MFCKHPKSKLFLAILVASLGLFPIATQALDSSQIILADRFDTTLWRWKILWGKVAIVKTNGNQVLSLSSTRPIRPNQTFSALAISRKTASNFSYTVTTKTVKHLRLNNSPNPWEVGWLFFRYRDLKNYYYLILKPNGYELGKKHGSDDQIFLVTGETPKLRLNQNYRLKVVAKGATIKVFVDDVKIIDFKDSQPILSGAVGLYEEDAHVYFDNILVTKL